MFGFVIGCFVGALLAVLVLSLCKVAARDVSEEACDYWGHELERERSTPIKFAVRKANREG